MSWYGRLKKTYLACLGDFVEKMCERFSLCGLAVKEYVLMMVNLVNVMSVMSNEHRTRYITSKKGNHLFLTKGDREFSINKDSTFVITLALLTRAVSSKASSPQSTVLYCSACKIKTNTSLFQHLSNLMSAKAALAISSL